MCRFESGHWYHPILTFPFQSSATMQNLNCAKEYFMLLKTFLFFIFTSTLYAQLALESVYYVQEKKVRFSSIVPDAKDDFLITTIEHNRYSQKIKSKDLLKLLVKHGYKHYTANSNYINFVLKSPVDTSLIEKKVREYYKKNYEDITIKSVFVAPRGYLASLPMDYSIEIKSRDYLSNEGILSIKTAENKKFFFDYTVVADVTVYRSRDGIKKDTQLTLTNCVKKSIALESFRDKPVQNIGQKQFQAKRHIPKEMILTVRDVEILDVVTRDSMINVNFFQDGMTITFSAKALQDGKVNDIIDVQNSSGKILKARVIGSDMAEME